MFTCDFDYRDTFKSPSPLVSYMHLLLNIYYFYYIYINMCVCVKRLFYKVIEKKMFLHVSYPPCRQ